MVQISIAFVMCLMLPAHSLAAACVIPPRVIEGAAAEELYQSVQGFILEQSTGLAQSAYVETVVQRFMASAKNAEGVVEQLTLEVDGEVVGLANNWVHVLKASTIAKAVAQGDLQPVKDWAIDEAIEQTTGAFASAIGATSNGFIIGSLITSLKSVKESYDVLEHEDCLTNIDAGYYRFLEDQKLRASENGVTPQGGVDYYIQNYLVGGGAAPHGSDRAENRRILQCFINAEMPEAERIDVSSLGAADRVGAGGVTGWFNSVFGTIGDTLGSAADAAPNAKRLRTPVNVMLRDFNLRANIEEQSTKLGAILRSDAYGEIEELTRAMQIASALADWICARLEDAGPHPDLIRVWNGTLDLMRPIVDGKPALEPIPFEMQIALDGSITGVAVINGEHLKFEGGEAIDREARFKWTYSIKEGGKTVEILDLLFVGALTEDYEFDGQMTGRMHDMGCEITNMFEDDKSKHRVCGKMESEGLWSVD